MLGKYMSSVISRNVCSVLFPILYDKYTQHGNILTCASMFQGFISSAIIYV